MSQPSPVASGQEMRTSRSLSSLAPGMVLRASHILNRREAAKGSTFDN